MYEGLTVGDFLDLVLDGGLPYGYRIYDYSIDDDVYDSEINTGNPDEYFDFEVENFNIDEAGVLEINIDTSN